MIKSSMTILLLISFLHADEQPESGLMNEDNARRYLESIVPSCDRGDPQSCYELGIFLVDESLPYKRRPDKAITYWSKACEKNHANACLMLADAYYRGQGTPTDYFKSSKILRRICDKKISTACYNLGVQYEKGEGVRQDITEAQELYGLSCDYGFQSGCTQFARINKSLQK